MHIVRVNINIKMYVLCLEVHKFSKNLGVTSKFYLPEGDKQAPISRTNQYYVSAYKVQSPRRPSTRQPKESPSLRGLSLWRHVTWVMWFARISNPVSTQLEKSRPAHNLQTEFFKNNVSADQMLETYVNPWNGCSKFAANRGTQLCLLFDQPILNYVLCQHSYQTDVENFF
jgi:hypothetical protein